MPDEPKRLIYWDACVFLSYINKHAGRFEVIAAVLEDAEPADGEIELITSFLSVVEVAYGLTEQQGKVLSADVEAKIDKLWLPDSPVKPVEVYWHVTTDARGLIREAMIQGWSLRAADATHLATARQMGASEFHTYDKDLFKYEKMTDLRICEPYTGKPRLGAEFLKKSASDEQPSLSDALSPRAATPHPASS